MTVAIIDEAEGACACCIMAAAFRTGGGLVGMSLLRSAPFFVKLLLEEDDGAAAGISAEGRDNGEASGELLEGMEEDCAELRGGVPGICCWLWSVMSTAGTFAGRLSLLIVRAPAFGGSGLAPMKHCWRPWSHGKKPLVSAALPPAEVLDGGGERRGAVPTGERGGVADREEHADEFGDAEQHSEGGGLVETGDDKLCGEQPELLLGLLRLCGVEPMGGTGSAYASCCGFALPVAAAADLLETNPSDLLAADERPPSGLCVVAAVFERVRAAAGLLAPPVGVRCGRPPRPEEGCALAVPRPEAGARAGDLPRAGTAPTWRGSCFGLPLGGAFPAPIDSRDGRLPSNCLGRAPSMSASSRVGAHAYFVAWPSLSIDVTAT